MRRRIDRNPLRIDAQHFDSPCVGQRWLAGSLEMLMHQLEIYFHQMLMKPALSGNEFPAFNLVASGDIIADEALGQCANLVIAQAQLRNVSRDAAKEFSPRHFSL